MIPRPDICFIAPDFRPERIGSIFIPGKVAHRDLPNTGTVRYLHPKANVEFKIGDRVAYNRHAQELWEIRDEKLTKVKTKDVIAIL